MSRRILFAVVGMLSQTAAARGDIRLSIVPVGSSTIGGGQQVTFEIHASSTVDRMIRSGQVDLPCEVSNGSGTLTSMGIVADSPALGLPMLCPGGIAASSNLFCRAAQLRGLGSPGCFMPANELRYVATITYEASDCGVGDFQVGFEVYSNPPQGGDLTKFSDVSEQYIPIIEANPAKISMGEISTGACCNGQTCLQDGMYAGCCTQMFPGASFYLDKNCGDTDACQGPCCHSGQQCTITNADSCSAQGGLPLASASACDIPEACCMGIGFCQMQSPACCAALGGMSQGEGSSCETPYVCCTDSPLRPLLWSEPWTSPGKIKGADLDGNAVVTLMTESTHPKGMAVDLQSQKIYWCSASTLGSQIARADWNGGNIEILLSEGINKPMHIALDSAEGEMYWTEAGTTHRIIRKASMTGTGAVTVFSVADNSPYWLDIDPISEQLYWSDQSNRHIARSNLDGSNMDVVIANRPGKPQGIALDVVAGRIYWTESAAFPNSPGVFRAHFDGTGIESLYVPASSAFGIALDLAAGKVYWAAGKIQRANLDGSNVEDLVQSATSPTGLALALPAVYGDMDDNRIIDVDDIICVVHGFSNHAECPKADLHPCGGNGSVDLDDVLTELDLFIQSGR